MPQIQESHWDTKLYILGKRVIAQLFMMYKTALIYDANNEAFLNALNNLTEDLKALMAKATPLTLESIEANFFLNEEKIKGDIYTHSAFDYLQKEFEKKKIGGVHFETLPSTEELKKFITIFSRYEESDSIAYEKINAALSKTGIDTITVLERRQKQLVAVDEDTVATNKAAAVKNYVRAVEIIKDSVDRLENNKGLDIRRAKRIVYNLVKHSFDEGYPFIGLASIKNYHAYTFHHSVNVCVIAIAFGQNLGLTKRQLADLGIGALYHDIGKLYIPKTVLNKEGGFSDEEWHIMKQHPVLAIQHLLPLKGPTDMDIKKVVPAFEHHRGYDLSGYPPMTIRKPLNFYSKVVAICDAYDAMTSSRVYQQGILPSEALQIILKGSNKKFDPLLVKAFINTMGIYPVASVVELSSGDLAIVNEVHPDPEKSERPKVTIIMDRAQRLKEPQQLDLATTQADNLVIVRSVNPEAYKINVAHYLLGT